MSSNWPGLITMVSRQALNCGYAWQPLRSTSAVLAVLWIMPRRAYVWVAILATATPVIPEPDWLNGQADEWLELIDASALEERHRQAAERATACLRDLRAARDLHDTHPVVASLIQAVERREVTAYSQAYQQVRQIEQTRRDQELRLLVENSLGSAVPGLIGAVAGSVGDTAWDDRFADWEHAWRWAVADNWLGKRTDFTYRATAAGNGDDDADDAIGRLLAESAALRAWTHFFNRLTHARVCRTQKLARGRQGNGEGHRPLGPHGATAARSAAVHGPMSRRDPSVDHAAVSGG